MSHVQINESCEWITLKKINESCEKSHAIINESCRKIKKGNEINDNVKMNFFQSFWKKNHMEINVTKQMNRVKETHEKIQ